MKPRIEKIGADRLLIGVIYSVSVCLIVGLIFSTLVTISKSQSMLFNHLTIYFASLLVMVLISTVITLLVSLFIGIPIVILLLKFGFDDELITAMTVSLVVLFLMLISGFTKQYSFLILIFYGFCCGFAFMRGYKQS